MVTRIVFMGVIINNVRIAHFVFCEAHEKGLTADPVCPSGSKDC
jgi:hypothetical protein